MSVEYPLTVGSSRQSSTLTEQEVRLIQMLRRKREPVPLHVLAVTFRVSIAAIIRISTGTVSPTTAERAAATSSGVHPHAERNSLFDSRVTSASRSNRG